MTFLTNELSNREVEAIEHASHGKNTAEIGREMYLTENTVKTHLRRAYEKLGAENRAHAVAICMRKGLVR